MVIRCHQIIFSGHFFSDNSLEGHEILVRIFSAPCEAQIMQTQKNRRVAEFKSEF
jgi:hypothetical protein